ncbi:MAG: M28 family peptidase [Bacteroidetes bacterium]|nr:M28 family peptidase [Bacteroidota bacterium]
MKKIICFTYYFLLLVSFFFSSCTNNTDHQPSTITHQPSTALPPAPKFNEDSAYSFVKAQVDFGPRIPGTNSHVKCAEYLSSKLKSFGWEVQIQNGNVSTYDKKKFNLKNIIASYKPEIQNRILLMSHWDTRPFADSDTINPDKPFDSADDGPSGVAVILEIARQLSIAKPEIGIDILFDDIEDYGKNFDEGENTWCLGTQYWTKNPHKPGYVAQYGILLDMVGAKNATFPREGVSREYASYVVKKIWNKAAHLGYSNYFVFEDAKSITDDHYYVIINANIPCVDIINMNSRTGEFGAHHHAHSDNMNVIDKNTLKTVGQTVLEVVWEEQKPQP